MTLLGIDLDYCSYVSGVASFFSVYSIDLSRVLFDQPLMISPTQLLFRPRGDCTLIFTLLIENYDMRGQNYRYFTEIPA